MLKKEDSIWDFKVIFFGVSRQKYIYFMEFSCIGNIFCKVCQTYKAKFHVMTSKGAKNRKRFIKVTTVDIWNVS